MRKRTIAAVAGGAAMGLAAAVGLGGARWNRATRAAADAVVGAGCDAGRGAPFNPAELAELPPPARRYFEFALTPGQTIPCAAQIRQRGEFAMKPGEWRPMRATHTIAVRPPGFVWDAAISMAPGMRVRVRDRYLGGSASMKAAVGGLVPMVDRVDTPGLAESALLRWLAEAPLVPAALLPRSGVAWEAMDEGTARASLSDGELTVTMVVHFAPTGEITRIEARRPRDVDGVTVPTPFEGRWLAYRRLHGMMIPTDGEAAWLLESGRYAFWRAQITGLEVLP